MSTLISVRVKCAVCGHSSWHSAFGSYYFSGQVGFDFQPVTPNPLCDVQYCPVCHYCAPSIGEVVDSRSTLEIDQEISIDIDELLKSLKEDDSSEPLFSEEILNLVKSAQSIVFKENLTDLDVTSFVQKYLDLSRFFRENDKARLLPHKTDKKKLANILESDEYKFLAEVIDKTTCKGLRGFCLCYSILYSYICGKFEWFSESGWYSLCCARNCYDYLWLQYLKKDETTKPRRRALWLFIETVLSGKSFHKNVVNEGLILVELSRRIKKFDLARQFLSYLEEAIVLYSYEPEHIQKKILQCQRYLLEREDSSEYSIDSNGNIFDSRGKRVNLTL